MPRYAARTFALLFALIMLAAAPLSAEETPRMFDWDTLPALPMPLSGHFAAPDFGSLIVAGGTNFPVSLFEGGTKEWYDSI